jgi:tRNA nucleotidyltransferase/poly(A) polymerase
MGKRGRPVSSSGSTAPGLSRGDLYHETVHLLRKLGVRAYLVGGAVRDMLQGRELHDLDFAVPEGAIDLARIVSDRLGGAFVLLDEERDAGRVVLRNARRGPVSIDFTRFRGAWPVPGGLPRAKTRGDGGIVEDLGARDFTINAMAFDVGEGEPGQVIDPLGGQADLAAGIIRATSPRAIADDPLRALRAVRLAGELGFTLAPATVRLIRESAPLLNRVSAERLRDELCKILAQPSAAGQLRALDSLGLLEPTLPEVAGLRGIGRSDACRPDLLEQAVERVAALEALLAAIALPPERSERPAPGSGDYPDAGYGPPASQVLAPCAEFLAAHLSAPTAGDRSRLVLLKLAALLCEVGKSGEAARLADDLTPGAGDEQISAAVAEKIARRLRFSKKEARLLSTIVGQHRVPYHLLDGNAPTRRAAYRFFRDAGGAGLDVLLLSLADHLEVAAFLLETYRDRRQAVISPPPLVTGHEVMQAFGLRAGPRLGQILDGLREEQAAGEVVNRQEAMAYVAQMLSERPTGEHDRDKPDGD